MKQIEYVPIPYAVFTDPGLSHAAKMTYGRLRLYAGRDGRCHPTHETLAREVCLEERQLRRVLIELRSAGLINWFRTRTSCVYEVFPDRSKMSTLEGVETGQKCPISTPETGQKCPLSEQDRSEMSDLGVSDRSKMSDLEWSKMSDRKDVSLKAAAAASAGGKKALRAALAKNGIPMPHRPDVENELTQMVEIAVALDAPEHLVEFIEFKAEQKKQQGSPIRSTKLALICVREDFPDWLKTRRGSEPSKPLASWTPPPPPTEEESRRARPDLWAEIDAERAKEKRAS